MGYRPPWEGSLDFQTGAHSGTGSGHWRVDEARLPRGLLAREFHQRDHLDASGGQAGITAQRRQ